MELPEPLPLEITKICLALSIPSFFYLHFIPLPFRQLTCKTCYSLIFQSGFTPLHLACMHGHLDVAEQLLSDGSDVEAKTKVITLCIIDLN